MLSPSQLVLLASLLLRRIMSGSLQWSGACLQRNWVNGMVFDEVGATADGRPFFKAQGQPVYIYFDARCNGKSTEFARWVLDSHVPNSTVAYDLDQDGDCMCIAELISATQRPPFSSTWSMACGDEWLNVAVALGDATGSLPSVAVAASDLVQWIGACDWQKWVNGVVFHEAGATADGRPFFEAEGQPVYIYFDEHCDGQSTTLATWVLNNIFPSTTAAFDLDQDRACSFFATLVSATQRLPTSGTWSMACGGDVWLDVAVMLSDVTTLVPPPATMTTTVATRLRTTTFLSTKMVATITNTTASRVGARDTKPGAESSLLEVGAGDVARTAARTTMPTPSTSIVFVAEDRHRMRPHRQCLGCEEPSTLPAVIASIVLASIVCVVTASALAVFLTRRHRRQRKKSGEAVAHACDDNNRHYYLKPSQWCVTIDQLEALLSEVDRRFPTEDPDVHTVVEQIIKPLTRHANESYALLLNPDGLPIKHFVTHTWAEGYKHFFRELKALSLTGGLWICFLANPQTWRPDELDRLFGLNAWLSPFASALREAESVIAVRNGNVNMYTRLWCVFELYLAQKLAKPMRVVGPPELGSLQNPVGYNAMCSSRRDLQKLRSAMKDCASDVDVWTHMMMGMQPTS